MRQYYIVKPIKVDMAHHMGTGDTVVIDYQFFTVVSQWGDEVQGGFVARNMNEDLYIIRYGIDTDGRYFSDFLGRAVSVFDANGTVTGMHEFKCNQYTHSFELPRRSYLSMNDVIQGDLVLVGELHGKPIALDKHMRSFIGTIDGDRITQFRSYCGTISYTLQNPIHFE